MSRNKHRGAADYIDGLKNAEKYERTFQREKRQKDAWEKLTRTQQIVALNKENARIGPVGEAIADTVVCQLPMCDRPPITLGGRSLGICYVHGVDVVTYFDINGEDFRQQLARVDRIESAARRDRLEEQRLLSRLDSPGWIYYVLIDGRIKIGYSIDVKRRLTAYPFDSPLLAMHPGTKRLETEMHQKFAGSRAAGREWFLDTAELRQHIKDVIAQFGEPDRARYERRGQRANKNLKAS